MAEKTSKTAKKAGAVISKPTPPEQRELAFVDNLSYRLSILGFLLGKATSEIYNAEDLTTHQWKVMSVICNFAPIPASEVMQWVTLDKSAISRAVRKLHAQGLIERKLSSVDARISQIMPTRKGRETYKRMATRISALQTELLGEISERKVQAMFDTFTQIESQLRERFGSEAD